MMPGKCPAAASVRKPVQTGARLLIAYIAFVSLGLPDAVIGIAWPSVRETFGLGQAALGYYFLAVGAGVFTSGIISGRLVQWLGLGPLLIASTLLASCALFGIALSPVWPVAVLAALVLGLGSGAIDAGVNGFAAANFSPRQVNWLHACYSTGAATGPLVMTAVLTGGKPWTSGYFTIAVTLLGMAVLFTATRGMWRSTPVLSRAAEPVAAPGAQSPPALEMVGPWEACRHPLVPVQMVIFFAYTGLEVTLGQWAYTVNTEGRGVAEATAGLWTSGYWAAILAGRITLGAIVERVGSDRLVRLATVGALAGSGLFALGGPGGGAVGLVIAGFWLAPIFPTLISRTAGRLPPGVAAHAVGFKISAAMVGVAVVPLVAGVAAETFGLEAVGFVAAATAASLLAGHEALLRMSSSEHSRNATPLA